MSYSLSAFNRHMKQVARQLAGPQPTSDTNKVVRAVALAVDQALVSATPVDTGRARSNWIPTVGSPSTAERAPMPPDALAAEAAAVVDTRVQDQTIYFTNNLDYIGKLNEGWSAQAPAGYVEKAVAAAASAIRGVRIRP